MRYIIKIFLIIALSVIINSCKEDVKTERKQKLKLEAVPVNIVDVNEEVKTIGRITPKKELKLSFKTSGIIKQINVDEGDKVKKGQLLASLNLTELNSMNNQAEIAYEKAKRDFERTSILYEDSVATLEQYQNAKSALNAAEAQLQISNFNVKHSIIKAPGSGVILKRLYEPKEMIAAGFPVFLFASSEEAWILRANIVADQLESVNIGDTAIINFDNREKAYKAIVDEIGSFADPYTATFKVELKFLNPPSYLATGMIAKATIFSSKKKSYIKIPASSVIEANRNSLEIYLFKNDSLFSKTVKLINSYNDFLYIENELDTNAYIISKGAHYIKNNIDFEVEINKSQK